MTSNTMIQRLIQEILRPRQQHMLGRWRIGYSEETISKIIERANEDHCGSCVVPPKEILTNEKKKAIASVAKYPPAHSK